MKADTYFCLTDVFLMKKIDFEIGLRKNVSGKEKKEMKRIGLVLPLIFLTGALSFAASAEEYDFDLSKISAEDLNNFESDVDSAIKQYHKLTSKEESAVLDAVKDEVEEYFSEGKVSWPWFDYSYTKDWDFYTITTHMDYKVGDESSEKYDIYGELYYDNGYVIYFLEAGHDRIIDLQDSIPQGQWMNTPDSLINSITGLDLSLLGKDELNKLKNEIDDEISANHTTNSTTNNIVRSLVKDQVEKKYNEPNWPWINYSYTNDWGFYTLTTSVNYKDAKDEKQKANVYAEAYPTDGDYELYYLAVGDDVLVDKREELPADLSDPDAIENSEENNELTEISEIIETETEIFAETGIPMEEDHTVHAPDKVLTGIIIEATMNTVTIQTEDESTYICATEDTEFDLVSGGIILGMEVEVVLENTTSNEYGLFTAETLTEIEESEPEQEEDILSYDEYMAADMDTLVTIETYVQAKQLNKDGSVSLYTQDQDGAYFIEEASCSEADYNSLETGRKIRVNGYKMEWAKEVEIDDATLKIIDDGDTFIAEPLEVANLLNDDNLINYQNQYVSFASMTIEPSEDKNGNEIAFLYRYNGAGSEGDDLYFNASYNGITYNFVVESSLCDSTTDVYQEVTNLEIGDSVDILGFLYWYKDVNPRVIGIDVVTHSEGQQTEEVNDEEEETETEKVETEAQTEQVKESPAAPEEEDAVLYENGARGDEVREVQEKLIELGYLSGTADGIFGGMTEEALRAFQEENGLESSGAITEKTMKALDIKNEQDGDPSFDLAFIDPGKVESTYFMFDTNSKKAIYFDSIDGLVMETVYTGELSEGVALDWSAYNGGEEWTEYFTYKDGSNTGTFKGIDGYVGDYEVCDLDEAMEVLNTKPGYGSENNSQTKAAEEKAEEDEKETQAKETTASASGSDEDEYAGGRYEGWAITSLKNMAEAVYPYGVKFHSLAAESTTRYEGNGIWYVKQKVDITNEYGAKRSTCLECRVDFINNTVTDFKETK